MNPTDREARLLDAIRRTWGYDSLRPLQRDAMDAILDGRDSIVVMPTGGGKSLCYQAPALVKQGLTVVISPLISLMKDQVDSLASNGVAAAALNSSLAALEQRAIEEDVRRGDIRLLFLSPERLAMASTVRLLEDAGASTFAIDEAHCISHWGHDFRPEYRQVRHLRKRFPNASFHAFTATATQLVRDDIARQLDLVDPVVLVGSFDRPNLTYRVVPRRSELVQVEEVVARHPGEAGIIYCIRRRDVDNLAAALRQRGRNVVAYHAGLTPEERRQAQEAFSREECDLVVATVAFGMGIDRSNVRFVMHTGMPKSIEHYQQETGRAGRDGLEAECVLLYSAGDAVTWRSILEKSDGEQRSDEFLQSALQQVAEMQRYATGTVCRHRALVEYFGQLYETAVCKACDVCIGGFETVADSVTIAQKILSCVARMGDAFGASHLTSVLRGENLARIRERGHDELTTFGIMREYSKDEIRDFIDQLVSMNALRSSSGSYPVIVLGPGARAILRSEATVTLHKRVERDPYDRRPDDSDWFGVDRALFERLRAWRKQEADARELPPYVIFGDRTLRAIAAARPRSLERLGRLYGLGQSKLAQFGQSIVEIVRDHGADEAPELEPIAITPNRRRPVRPNVTRETALAAFERDASIEEVVEQTGRARSTVFGYLADFIETRETESLDRWVAPEVYERVATSAERHGFEILRPIFEDLHEDVPYEIIRLVVTHLGLQRARAQG